MIIKPICPNCEGRMGADQDMYGLSMIDQIILGEDGVIDIEWNGWTEIDWDSSASTGFYTCQDCWRTFTLEGEHWVEYVRMSPEELKLVKEWAVKELTDSCLEDPDYITGVVCDFVNLWPEQELRNYYEEHKEDELYETA